ncbi:MAG: type II toxin-antitoxin system Phd/YefM family antitoxin [Gammaproteobacteria bacterium]|jgi:prevent-host-death family protein|nr:type II toxin-antitoxin system Phd/YefM family antitoxin [Gammaproteobacteria bacterium]
MKTMQATDAKNRFGELLDEAASGPVRIQKNGRDVAIVMSSAEYDRLFLTASKKELIQRYHEESIERFGPLYEALAK